MSSKCVFNVVFVICACLAVSDAAKLLVVFSFGAHSHLTLGFRLAKELADKGHEVTFISAYPQKTPIKNLKEISTASIMPKLDEIKSDLYNMGQMSYLGQLFWVAKLGQFYTDHILQLEEIQELLNSGEKFDAVILEHFMNEAMTIFAHKLKCPMILFAPGPTTVFNNYLFANPAPSSYVPSLLADFGSSMTLWERLKNTYYDIAGELFIHLYMLPKQEEILKKRVPGAPDLEDILYKSNLMLLTSHISIQDPAPLQPGIKEIGGYHVGPLKPLPKDLQDYLDNAKEGVILFSMGSNLKSADFPKDKKDAVLRVFSRLKQKVLWKFEVDLPEKPPNVKIMKWLPQQDILAHPNVIVFITHVGLLSTIEAVYHGVPLLGLPVYWDQQKNIEDAERKGFGISLPFPELTEAKFQKALNELINNPKYRDTMKTRSSIMKDVPTKQLDSAVFWIEHVVKHKGAPHLRSAGLNLRWYQRLLLDVLVFVVSIFLILFGGIYFFAKLLFNKENNKTQIKKKKN